MKDKCVQTIVYKIRAYLAKILIHEKYAQNIFMRTKLYIMMHKGYINVKTMYNSAFSVENIYKGIK